MAGAVIVFLAGFAAFLLGKELNNVFGEVLEHLGTFVATAVLVSFLYEYFIRQRHDSETLAGLQSVLTGPSMLVLINDHDLRLHGRIEAELRSWLETHVEQAGVFGLSGFERRFDYCNVFERLQEGDELLWLNNFCPDGIQYRDSLIAAVSRGASVRMLVAKPGSETSNMRAREIETQEEFRPPHFAGKIKEELRILQAAARRISSVSPRGSFEVRTYSDLPGTPMYLYLHNGTRRMGYSSFYLADPSVFTPHLRWQEVENGILERLHRYYVRKWDAHGQPGNLVVRVDSDGSFPGNPVLGP